MKKILITVTLLIAILIAGIQFANLVVANPNISLNPTSPPDLTLIPPIISITTPKNNTFYNVNSIILTFNVTIPNSNSSISNPKWWTYYSADWIKGTGDMNTVLIDMQSSVTFKEYSINLTDIPEGKHNITVYATSWFESEHYANSTISQVLINFNVDFNAPYISNLSIENKTYNLSELPLSFVVNEISQISYSLDNQVKVTINGNTTLKDLISGNHNLTVYVIDSAGNIGKSETINFSVNTPFPIIPVTASVGIVAIVAVSLLVYSKKHKR